MTALIFNKSHSLFFRLGYLILPFFLASSIIFIFATFTFTVFSLLSAGGGFAISIIATLWTLGAWMIVAVLFVKTLQSLGYALFSDPGSVPISIQHLFRGVAQEFFHRQHPGEESASSSFSMMSGSVGGGGEDDFVLSSGGGIHSESTRFTNNDSISIHFGGGGGGEGGVPRSFIIPETIFLAPGPHDPRWCKKCRQIKPPRTHHCSICERCILKMDHHCPWVGQCVGWGNYKAFCQLLVFGCAATLVTLSWWLPLATGAWRPLPTPPLKTSSDPHNRFNWRSDDMTFAAIILACTYGCMLILFASAHGSLIASAMTTIESASGISPSPYSHDSVIENFKQVFGSQATLWFSPSPSPDVIATTCQGCDFTRTIAATSRGERPGLREYPLSNEDLNVTTTAATLTKD